MKKSYKEIEISVWNFDKDVTTNFIQASGDAYEKGDLFVVDDFE
jgi:hypothetical protein